MSRLSFLLMLCCLSFGCLFGETTEALAGPVAPGQRLALLVGVGDYDQSGPTPWRRLNSRKDVEGLRRVLIEHFAFADDDILVLLDRQATTQAIRSAFREHLVNKARPGATVVFHFSGHGQQIRDDNGDEIDGLDESLVTYDAKDQSAMSGGRNNLRDDELGALLKELRGKMTEHDMLRGSINVFLDTCFSGTGSRTLEPGVVVERGRPWNESIDGPLPVASGKGQRKSHIGWLPAGQAEAQGYVLLAASQSDQTAKELHGMGAFSRALIQGLSQATPTTTYRDLFERVSVEVAGALRDQNPQIEGMENHVLFGGAARILPPYVVVSAVQGNQLTLPIGQIHGATVGSRFQIYRAGADVTTAAGRLAEATITDVQETSSNALLDVAQQGKLTAKDLLAARAVESAHRYADHPLLVYLDFQNHWPAMQQALEQLDILTTQGASDRHYDVRISADSQGRLVLLRKTSATPFAVVTANDQAAEQIQEILKGEWRWQFVLKLDNPNPDMRVTVRVVSVNARANAAGRVVTPPVPRKDVERTDHLIFREGDYFMLELKNTTAQGLYVSVFELSPDGSIGPLFPHPQMAGGDNLIPGDGKVHSIPLPFVFRLRPPFGMSLVKVIATRTKVDFSPILYDAARLAQPGGELEAQLSTNPLARVLLSAASGTRSRPVGIEPAAWGTNQVWIELRPR